jgi:hypothetical protein
MIEIIFIVLVQSIISSNGKYLLIKLDESGKCFESHFGKSKSFSCNAGLLKLFCTATLSKYLQNFRDPKLSQSTTNLR